MHFTSLCVEAKLHLRGILKVSHSLLKTLSYKVDTNRHFRIHFMFSQNKIDSRKRKGKKQLLT